MKLSTSNYNVGDIKHIFADFVDFSPYCSIINMKKLFRTVFFFFPTLVFEPFYFELKSFLGRLFQSDLKVNAAKSNYINLGCGPIVTKGMINIDFFFEKGIDYGADLRYPLRIPSESIDGIICEHTFEHLDYSSDLQMFQECYRILKPGGVFRIILPDLSLFLKAYVNNDENWFKEWERMYFTTSKDSNRAKRKLKTHLEAVSFVMQEYGHISAWDFNTLKAYLSEVGFTTIEQTEWRQGKVSELLIDTDMDTRKHVSIYLEAVKS